MKFSLTIIFFSFILLQVAEAGRYYDPDNGRFMSRDKKGYVDGMNLYSGYFANYFAVDPMGTDVIVVQDIHRLNGAGHPGILVGSDKDGWYYFSWSTGSTSWFSADNMEIKVFKSLKSALASKELHTYDEFARWKTKRADDLKAINKGFKLGSTSTDYKLIGHNCEDVIYYITKEAGVTWLDKLVPNKSWKENKTRADSYGVWKTTYVPPKPPTKKFRKETPKEAEVRKRIERDTNRVGCFLRGVKVKTEYGNKNIEDFKHGDMVLSYSDNGWEYKPVTKIHRHKFEGNLITLSSGDFKLTSTYNHPFFVLSGKDLEKRKLKTHKDLGKLSKGYWVEAESLRIGDKLMSKGAVYTISDIKVSQYKGWVYNIRVKDNHSYCVGGHGILVHNK